MLNDKPSVPEKIREVVEPIAYEMISSGELDKFQNSAYETIKVTEMNLDLREAEATGDYSVITSLAFIIPEDLTTDEEGNVQITRMDGDTEFRGDLIGGATAKLFRDLGFLSVRAVCLRFSDVLINYRTAQNNAIIPMFKQIDDTHRLFVPYFALKSMRQAS